MSAAVAKHPRGDVGARDASEPQVAREILAAVELFCKAVQQETATAELVRGCLQELRRKG